MIGKWDMVVRKRGHANSNENEVLDKVSTSHTYTLRCFLIAEMDGILSLRFDAGKRQAKLTNSMLNSWRMFQQRNEFIIVLARDLLFQHHLVDHFHKIEAETLSFLPQNQQSVRAENCTASSKIGR